MIHTVCSFLFQINYFFKNLDHPIENNNSFSLAILLGARLKLVSFASLSILRNSFNKEVSELRAIPKSFSYGKGVCVLDSIVLSK